MTPHICPKCQGERVVMNNAPATSAPLTRDCPTCEGEGVLWQPVYHAPVWSGKLETTPNVWTSGVYGSGSYCPPDGTYYTIGGCTVEASTPDTLKTTTGAT